MFRTRSKVLPLPPLELRHLVGPIEDSSFDNPAGKLILPHIPAENFRSVLDFGCGCGRLARQLIQQTPQPKHYLGVDIHRGMITWCQENLTPAAPQFRFVHAVDRVSAFPVPNQSVSLALAHSVFTHLLEDQALFDLKEIARALTPDGLLYATWFLFDKKNFPMMTSAQNCLYINRADPTNAVFYDRNWFLRAVDEAGLALTWVQKPVLRGFHWFFHLRRQDQGFTSLALPEDDAPVQDLTALAESVLLGNESVVSQPRPVSGGESLIS